MRRPAGAWEQGQWDPAEETYIRQWWEDTAAQTRFMNALRECLGLEALPCVTVVRDG